MVMEEVDTVLENFGTETENQEELTQTMSTPKNNYDLRRKSASLKNLRLVNENQSV